MPLTLVENVRVFDGRVLRTPSDVLFQNSPGNVMSIELAGTAETQADHVIDGGGCTLMAAFIDAKIDAGAAESALETLASFGIGTVIDLSSSSSEAQAMRLASSADQSLPHYYSSGTTAVAKDCDLSRFPIHSFNTVDSLEEVEAFVNARVDGPEKADYIMVVCDAPGLEDHLLAALVNATHRRGKVAAAQAASIGGYERALHAGFDVITKVPLDGMLSEEIALELAARKVICIPTLCILERFTQQSPREEEEGAAAVSVPGTPPTDIRRHGFDRALFAVKTLHEAGVVICAGTGANPSREMHVSFGESIHHEMELLVRAGMSESEALRSASYGSAQSLGFKEQGVLEVGQRADLVLLDGNPLEDIRNTRRIRKVWLRGIEIVSRTD